MCDVRTGNVAHIACAYWINENGFSHSASRVRNEYEFVAFCPKIHFSSWHYPTVITAHLSAVTYHSNRKLTLAVERESSQCGGVLAPKAVFHLAATQAFLMHVNTTIYNRSSANPLELGHNCCATEGSPFIGFWILCHILHANAWKWLRVCMTAYDTKPYKTCSANSNNFQLQRKARILFYPEKQQFQNWHFSRARMSGSTAAAQKLNK